MDWTSWRRHFEANAARPEPAIESAPEVPAAWRAPVASSLARFQLGEAGEGRIANEIDRVRLDGVDADYRAALKRFVAEEGRHARILAKGVLALGGTLLGRTWTERLFVRARRLLGVRLKLLVLLAAEVIGIGFYGLISERLPPGALRRALEQIVRDERAHLRFHLDFFRANGVTAARRWALSAAWWCVGGAAAGVVWVDHARTLLALGVPLSQAAGLLAGWVARAARGMRSEDVGVAASAFPGSHFRPAARPP